MNTAQDIIDLARTELGDPEIGSGGAYSFWKNWELLEYVSNAQQEFSKYTKCFPNTTDYALYVASGVRVYSLEEEIHEVFGGRLSASGNRVKVDSFSSVERRHLLNHNNIAINGSWELETGTPKYMIQDMEFGSVVLYPTPVEADTLNLYVYKLSSPIISPSENLEIIPQHRFGLIFRVMSLAFNKIDAANIQDTEKLNLSAQRWQSFLQDAKSFYDTLYKRTV